MKAPPDGAQPGGHRGRAGRDSLPDLRRAQRPDGERHDGIPIAAVGSAGLAAALARLDSATGAAIVSGLQRTRGNAWVQRMVDSLRPSAEAASVSVQRDAPPATSHAGSPQTGATSPGEMTRAQFEEEARRRFGVGRVHTATLEDQLAHLNRSRPSGAARVALPEGSWRQWDPGPSSSLYRWIVSSFSEFASRVGGLPGVTEIVFYDTCYDVDRAGRAVENRDVPADFGGGRLSIYSAIADPSNRRPLPIGRSTAGGRYPPVGIGVATRGSRPGAPMPVPSRREDVLRIVTHELGHGLVETALTPRAGGPPTDPNIMDDYRLAVGWTAGGSPELYDAGVPAVRAALASGSAPPRAMRITEDNWNDPRWVEQPLTGYMVSAPHEDLPEAVMAYVCEPDLLRSRSPRRYEFLASRRERWLPQLLRLPQLGDFPQAGGGTRVA